MWPSSKKTGTASLCSTPYEEKEAAPNENVCTSEVLFSKSWKYSIRKCSASLEPMSFYCFGLSLIMEMLKTLMMIIWYIVYSCTSVFETQPFECLHLRTCACVYYLKLEDLNNSWSTSLSWWRKNLSRALKTWLREPKLFTESMHSHD